MSKCTNNKKIYFNKGIQVCHKISYASFLMQHLGMTSQIITHINYRSLFQALFRYEFLVKFFTLKFVLSIFT